MKRAKIFFSAAIGLCCVLLNSCGGVAAVSIGQLAVLGSVVSEVQKALSAVVAQADDAAKNNISRVDTAARDNTKRINDVVNNAANSTAEQREELARQAFAVLSDSQKVVDASGKDLFANLNQTLASVSATLDALPFVRISDTVFAVSPYKMRKDARDREVSIFGFFPSIAENASAVVVTVNGSPVQVKRSAGKVFFDATDDILKLAKPMADIRIQLPSKGWLSRKPTPIDARLRVLSDVPYNFTIEAMKDTLAAYATLDGRPHTEGADSSNPNRNVHLDAIGLFNTSVSDAKYDPSTAQIVNVREQPAGHGKACEDCPDPSGRISSWTASAVEIALNAPSCANHFIRHDSDGPFGIKIPGGYLCGGGGSHYEVSFIPTFTVRVKGVPDSTPIEAKSIKAAWSSVSTLDLPQDWTSVVVRLRYDDNFDKADTIVVVKKAVPTASLAAFDVKVENNKMYISTR
jgi:hypothetical protein